MSMSLSKLTELYQGNPPLGSEDENRRLMKSTQGLVDDMGEQWVKDNANRLRDEWEVVKNL